MGCMGCWWSARRPPAIWNTVTPRFSWKTPGLDGRHRWPEGKVAKVEVQGPQVMVPCMLPSATMGAEADALLSASADVATTVELHQTIKQDGKMVMRPLPRVDIPAGGRLEMKPGSYHIMLLGLKQDLKPGETVNVGLSFEKAGQMSVKAAVK